MIFLRLFRKHDKGQLDLAINSFFYIGNDLFNILNGATEFCLSIAPCISLVGTTKIDHQEVVNCIKAINLCYSVICSLSSLPSPVLGCPPLFADISSFLLLFA